MNNLEDRLDAMKEKISSVEFQKNLGSANEVSYFVFDYDPSDEIFVRDYVTKLANDVNHKTHLDYNIKVFDLYNMMIDYLKEEDILEDVFMMEEDEGYDEVAESIKDSLGVDTVDDNYYINYIEEHIDDNSIVFITGVGKIYPIVRAHKILNNLHQQIDNIPVILFLPGVYNGLEIKLFGKLNSNYYRAFKLID
ncbi:MAG: DUF1788 domain-containing protein [Erysipelotrichaceae bacterium]|nr:DUF1788 domain-containing protein [Erysipelotrichaceae bacterium]